jgi:hypothetical protein
MPEHARRRSIVDTATVVLKTHQHLLVAIGDEAQGKVRLAA